VSTRLATVVEPLGSDLIALAQCIALDVSTFPHPSLPPVLSGPLAPHPVWVARAPASAGAPLGVVGFAAGRWKRGYLEIAGLAVDARARRQGVGRALLGAATAAARGRRLGAVILHVSTGNPGAYALYRSEGFHENRLLAGFYSSREFPDDGDALEMILTLGGG
jgi:ribosomal protein S18 acetylase RimI-like enzyme